MQALFYGIGAAVIAIIAMAAYRLARGTNKRDPLLWVIFGVLFGATVWTGAELGELFLLAGIAVIVLRSPPDWLRLGRSAVLLPLLPFVPAAAEPAGGGLLGIFAFFAKAGLFVFGSGLAIVPFLHQGVVVEHAWLTEHQFLDAVAVALITPGPVVITVAFIGYLVAGIGGATAAALGMFLPVYVLTIVPAPWFAHHRNNPQLRSFVAGCTAAASGAIAGAVVVLGQRAIIDVPTAVIALVGVGLLWRIRLSEPVLVAGAGLAGLALWPLLGRGSL